MLPEESEEWRALSLKYGMSNIFLIALDDPGTTEFSISILSLPSLRYPVSVTGVTGARSSFGDMH